MRNLSVMLGVILMGLFAMFNALVAAGSGLMLVGGLIMPTEKLPPSMGRFEVLLVSLYVLCGAIYAMVRSGRFVFKRLRLLPELEAALEPSHEH